MNIGDDARFTDLIRKARNGDRAVLGKLLLANYPWLLRRLRHNARFELGGFDNLEDVLQDVFLMVVRDIEQCQASTVLSFRAWLGKIADHRILDTAKRLGRQKRKPANTVYNMNSRAIELTDTAAIRDPVCLHAKEPTEERTERYQEIRREVTNLPEDQRHAILLHYLDGKTISATAVAMSRSTGAVRGLLQRARSALRERCASG